MRLTGNLGLSAPVRDDPEPFCGFLGD